MRHRNQLTFAHAVPRTFSAALLLMVPTLALTGCDSLKERLTRKLSEKAAETLIESQSGEKVEIDSKAGTMRVQSKDGKGTMTLGIDTKVPDNFPKSIPLYPAAKLMTAMGGTTDKGDGGFMLSFTSADSVEKVGAFYADAAAKGAKKVMDMATPVGRTVSWQTADGVTASAVVNVDQGTTTLVIQANTAKTK